MTVRIHGVPQSTFVRSARMACTEAGIQHDLVQIGNGTLADVLAGLKSPDYLAKHPFGRMPCLQDGDVTVFETSAISRYVSGRYGNGCLVPSDPLEAVRMEQWVSAANCYILPDTLGRFIAQYVFRDEPDMTAVEEAKPKLRSHYQALDDALAGRTTLAGESVTVADILIAPALHVVGGLPGGMDLFSGLENLGRWWEAISARESFVLADPTAQSSKASAA